MMRLYPYPVSLCIKMGEFDDQHILALTEIEGNVVTVTIGDNTSISEFVHESIHVAQYVEQYIGQELDMESFAYLSQWVFQIIYEKVSKHGRVAKIKKNYTRKRRP